MSNKISFEESKILSKLALDYSNNPDDFSEFISYAPKMESFEKIIAAKQSCNRRLLVEQLKKQNKNSHKNSLKNIELIEKENTFTITTGHQICLFTGPLYSIYKIISIINLAQNLNEKSKNYHFVPLFWMATEDHDFEEINHIHLYDRTITWNTNQKGPVGRFDTSDITHFLEEVKELVSSDLSNKLSSFYLNAPNLAEAHRKVIDYLFGEYGVVILDADNRELKKEMIPIFKQELLEPKTANAVDDLSEKLVEKGYKKQVNPRNINLFYQEKGLRERILKTEEGFEVINTPLKFTEEEILMELNNFPEKFSPNVILRPVYQEKILPNLAYIGGPGELAYWLQLKKGFKTNQVDFPILVLRNSVLLIKQNVKKKIDKLPFELKQYFLKEDELVKQYLNKVSEISFEEEIQSIEKIFEITKEKAIEVDFSLERTVIAELKRAQNSINKIKKKVTKAEKNNHTIALNQISAIKNSFFPHQSFQERYHNILEFYDNDLIKKLTNNLISLEDNITLIQL